MVYSYIDVNVACDSISLNRRWTDKPPDLFALGTPSEVEYESCRQRYSHQQIYLLNHHSWHLIEALPEKHKSVLQTIVTSVTNIVHEIS